MKQIKNHIDRLKRLKQEELIQLLFITLFYTIQILFIALVIPQKTILLPQINSTFVLITLYLLCAIIGTQMHQLKDHITLLFTLYCGISIGTILTTKPYEFLEMGALSGALSGAILYSLKHQVHRFIYTRKLAYHLLMKTYRASFALSVIAVLIFLTIQAETRQLYLIVIIALLSLAILFNHKISNLIHKKQTK